MRVIDAITRVFLAVVAAGAIHLAAPAATVASAVCPPPGTLDDIIAVDADHHGPLTEAFPPIYGPYAEGAAACWPGQEIVVTAFISSPEGLGGTRSYTIEPAWLVSQAHFLSTSATVDAESGPVGPFLPVAVPPGLEGTFTNLAGHWVRASGHFDDEIAQTCVVTEGDPDASPTPEQAIQICQTSFVLTAVAPLMTPNTDAAPSEQSADMQPGLPALSLAVATAAALALSLRRSARIRVTR
jgi:hypothetical protein